ncbi:type I DNA topoisomerase [Candidatus Latescibacterota bacterium]
MAKSLVIVESPAKAKTINKFLGTDYIVKPTGGHIIDLPAKDIGIDIDNEFKPHYMILKDKKKTVADLKKAAKSVDDVILATDPDREGEAIAWHVANNIVGKEQKSYRILLNQITRDAVINAVNNKGTLDINKVNAQQARRILDRLVGYKVSPFLWKTMFSGLSAGRVQSVALRLVVERDEIIDAFVPEEYWEIKVLLSTKVNEEFEAKLVKKSGKALKIKNADESSVIVSELKSLPFIVDKISKKKKNRNPLPPFITSTLQQEASSRYGFTVSRTMRIAQTLYEGVELNEGSVGLITYMRTDSTRVAPEAIEDVRTFILDTWGTENLPGKPNYFKTKKGAQDAHEAIRPSNVEFTPDRLKASLTSEQLKLYTVIWKRFVASQMKPAIYSIISAQITAGDYELTTSASHIDFKGFLNVYEEMKKDNDEEGPQSEFPKTLTEKESLNLKNINPSQHFTKPPPRYTEASLVKEMEAQGIGRPSTYAQTINTIKARDYVNRDKGKLQATELGRNVNKILVQGFPNLFSVEFTANMEEELDKIESGEHEWLDVLDEFYGPFNEALERINSKRKELKESLIEDTGEKCEKCGKPMMIRWGRRGKFIACSGFPACRNTRPIEKQEDQVTDEKCEKCGAPMVIKNVRNSRFLGCSNYPSCKNIKPISLGIKCPVESCGGDIVEKRTKRGKIFYGCSNYPKCTFASWNRMVASECKNCGAPSLIEGKKGETYSCAQCKSRFSKDEITV